jgi:hypothetical protein
MTEALLELLNDKHDLLVAQLTAPRRQQEKLLEVLQKFMGSRHTVAHCLLLTTEEDLLPPLPLLGTHPMSIQVLNRDLSSVWLSAYLPALWPGGAAEPCGVQGTVGRAAAQLQGHGADSAAQMWPQTISASRPPVTKSTLAPTGSNTLVST